MGIKTALMNKNVVRSVALSMNSNATLLMNKSVLLSMSNNVPL